MGLAATRSTTTVSVTRQGRGPRRGHRWRTATAAIASVLLIAIGRVPASPATSQTKPNVVVIIADDLSFELIDRLPNVQSLLVDHGMTFTNMYAADPLCCPSRLSFLRGQNSHTTSEYNVQYTWGAWQHAVATGLENQTLPVWAAADGYYTAEQGKYLNGYKTASTIPPGWTDWRAMMRFGYLPNDATHTYWTASVQGHFQRPAEYAPDWVSDQAVDAIARSGSMPLFMWTAYFDPHTPWQPPPRYDTLGEATPCQGVDVSTLPGFNEATTDTVDGTTDKPRWVQRTPYSSTKVASLQTAYERQCQSALAIDDGVARIVSALEVKDPGLQNTIIVFTSDQGLQNGAHMHTAKKVPWDESAKLPFVMRDDAVIGAASTNDSLLTNVDFAPTIEDLTGITGTPDCPTGGSVYETACEAHGGGFDGFSFAPLLSGGNYVPRDSFLIEHWDPSTLNVKVPTYCAIRSRTGLLVRYWANDTSGADWEGYDLTTDPGMLHSLVFSAAGTPATATPEFRPGGQALYDSLVSELHAACNPQPPGYPGF